MLESVHPNVLALAAAFFLAAALCVWTAVQMGEVVQVVPINRLSVLFAILFSWIFFRKQELITIRRLLGAALSVLGAFVIAEGG